MRISSCTDCDVVRINGVTCHETGCPSAHIDPDTGQPYRVECMECGSLFEPESRGDWYCNDDCRAAIYGE